MVKHKVVLSTHNDTHTYGADQIPYGLSLHLTWSNTKLICQHTMSHTYGADQIPYGLSLHLTWSNTKLICQHTMTHTYGADQIPYGLSLHLTRSNTKFVCQNTMSYTRGQIRARSFPYFHVVIHKVYLPTHTQNVHGGQIRCTKSDLGSNTFVYESIQILFKIVVSICIYYTFINYLIFQIIFQILL